jgi:hypothetical protein
MRKITTKMRPQKNVPTKPSMRALNRRPSLCLARLSFVRIFLHRSRGDDLTRLDDGDPVAEGFRHLEGVGGQEDRAALVHEGLKEVLEEPSRSRIQAHHGLVHDDELGLVDERRGDEELLAHAVRIALDELVTPLTESEQVQQSLPATLGLRAITSPQPGHEPEELSARQLLVQVGAVGNVADLRLGLLGLVGHVDAVDEDLTGGGAEHPGHHADGGRLAGPVRAQEPEDLSTLGA